MTKGLQRVREGRGIKHWFTRWRDAMLDRAEGDASALWLPDCKLVAQPRILRDSRIRFKLGDDPCGKRWAVEINEPLVSSDYNSLSAVAVDADGRHFLLRQGVLRPNVRGGETIGTTYFEQSSDLAPVRVEDVGLAAKRSWYLVARLEHSDFAIRQETSEFVEACSKVRGWTLQREAKLREFTLSPESGENYVIGPKGPQDLQEVMRKQGRVWLKLKKVLDSHDIQVCKAKRHAQGFQVDALVGVNGSMRLLVEIKTSVSSSDIHAGVGQLHLYRKLMPGLAELKPILLLPCKPSDDVLRALRDLQIAAHFYDFGDGTTEQISFSDEFLEECGLMTGAN